MPRRKRNRNKLNPATDSKVAMLEGNKKHVGYDSQHVW